MQIMDGDLEEEPEAPKVPEEGPEEEKITFNEDHTSKKDLESPV